MQCHYCSSSAEFSVEKDGVKVGLCDTHLQEQLSEFEDADTLQELRRHVDAHELTSDG